MPTNLCLGQLTNTTIDHQDKAKFRNKITLEGRLNTSNYELTIIINNSIM